jgi:hypothetical protein
MAQPSQFEVSTQAYLTATCNMVLNTAVVDQVFYIAPEPMEVVEIHEIHATKGTDGSAVTATVKRCQGTEDATAGDDLLGATKINLKGDNNTLQSPALTSTTADLQLAAGDRLSIDITGTTTAVAGAVVTVLLKRI